MRLFEVQPGGHTPHHEHEWEHEVYILQGSGAIVSDEGEMEFKAGDAIWVSPKERHQFKNTGAENLRFLCLIPTMGTCT
ncbi:MAG TPA: cupin domain-containing protein [bacterium]|nr:cupin domain-containing protein [bacterium]